MPRYVSGLYHDEVKGYAVFTKDEVKRRRLRRGKDAEHWQRVKPAQVKGRGRPTP